jgi:hypothetical protein
MTMLEVAIETSEENPSPQATAIIELLKSKGAKIYDEVLVAKPKNNLPPLSVKGPVRGNIKTSGIAGLPRRGGTLRRRRLRSRKNRR